MGNSLGLLLQIGADPSQAEAALKRLAETSGSVIEGIQGQFTQFLTKTVGLSEQFTASAQAAARDLAVLSGPVTGSDGALLGLVKTSGDLAETTKKMDQAITDALVKLDRQAPAALRDLQAEINRLAPAYHQSALEAILFNNAIAAAGVPAQQKAIQSTRQWRLEFTYLREEMSTAISEITGRLTGMGGVATRVFDQVANLIIRQIEIDKAYAIEHATSQASIATSTLTALKSTAEYKFVEAMAKGFSALGDLDFWAAAQYFASAALWGTLSAVQIGAALGAFGGGGRAAGAGRGTGGAGGTISPGSLTPAQQGALLAPGAAGVYAPTPSGKLTVIVVGEAAAGQHLARLLNKATQNNDVKLVASHVISPAPVSRSGRP